MVNDVRVEEGGTSGPYGYRSKLVDVSAALGGTKLTQRALAAKLQSIDKAMAALDISKAQEQQNLTEEFATLQETLVASVVDAIALMALHPLLCERT